MSASALRRTCLTATEASLLQRMDGGRGVSVNRVTPDEYDALLGALQVDGLVWVDSQGTFTRTPAGVCTLDELLVEFETTV